MIFPVPYIPNENYRGSRGFGADRSKVAALLAIPGGKLKHGAVDLVVPPKTPVLAMEDGVVLSGPRKFFLNVYAIEVQHSRFIARYCEISEVGAVRIGAMVKEGQVIAYVGDQPGADMLHLELFSGMETGSLSLSSKDTNNAPYYRRKDLMDPTSVLDQLRGTVARAPFRRMSYRVEADGRKYVNFPSDLAGMALPVYRRLQQLGNSLLQKV